MNSAVEKLGAFYVGHEEDAASGQERPEPLPLDPATVTLTPVQIAARTADIEVAKLAAGRAPWRNGADGFPAPAY